MNGKVRRWMTGGPIGEGTVWMRVEKSDEGQGDGSTQPCPSCNKFFWKARLDIVSLDEQQGHKFNPVVSLSP